MPVNNLTVGRQLLSKGALLMQLTGIIDAQTFESLESEFQLTLDRGGFRIIVDLAGVGYVSSAGIGVFMNAITECRLHGGDVVLLHMSSDVMEVFDSLNLTGLFKTADSLEGALEMF